MKKFVALLFIVKFAFICHAQDNIPKGYRAITSLSITGDFDGNGIEDVLSQFVTDSLGNKVDYIIELEENDHPILLYDRYGYRGSATLNNKPTNIKTGDIGLYCLINLGNINKTKGDEVALVPINLDYSNLNHCSIYSYCKEHWVLVFSFNVNESSFDFEGDNPPIFTNIPGALEKHKNQWYYNDYLEELESENDESVANMKPLKASNCE